MPLQSHFSLFNLTSRNRKSLKVTQGLLGQFVSHHPDQSDEMSLNLEQFFYLMSPALDHRFKSKLGLLFEDPLCEFLSVEVIGILSALDLSLDMTNPCSTITNIISNQNLLFSNFLTLSIIYSNTPSIHSMHQNVPQKSQQNNPVNAGTCRPFVEVTFDLPKQSYLQCT
jgi:hypothetical protein